MTRRSRFEALVAHAAELARLVETTLYKGRWSAIQVARARAIVEELDHGVPVPPAEDPRQAGLPGVGK